jgi:hypothetical protein
MGPIRRLTWLALATTGVFLLATPARADYSLREKQYMKGEEKELAKAVKNTNEKCKMKLKAVIDWKSWRKEMNRILDGKRRSVYSYCQLVPDNMWSMCSDKTAAGAIRKKIKTYVCKFGGKGKRNIKLTGSTLSFWVDWKAPNNDPYIKKYLGKKL